MLRQLCPCAFVAERATHASIVIPVVGFRSGELAMSKYFPCVALKIDHAPNGCAPAAAGKSKRNASNPRRKTIILIGRWKGLSATPNMTYLLPKKVGADAAKCTPRKHSLSSRKRSRDEAAKKKAPRRAGLLGSCRKCLLDQAWKDLPRLSAAAVARRPAAERVKTRAFVLGSISS